MRGERTCIVDKIKYRYCPNCNGDNPNETWRYIFCSENCRNLYKTLEDWKAKKITSAQAKQQLNKLEIPKDGVIQVGLLNDIMEINKETETKKRKPRKKISE